MTFVGQLTSWFPGLINGLPDEWRGDLPPADTARLRRFVTGVVAQSSCVVTIVLLLVHLSFGVSARAAANVPERAFQMPGVSIVLLVMAVLIVSVVPLLLFSSQMPSRTRSSVM